MKMVNFWQELDLSLGDSTRYRKRVENKWVFKFFVGLERELNVVQDKMLGRRLLPSVRELFSEIRRQESRRKVMMRKDSFGDSHGGLRIQERLALLDSFEKKQISKLSSIDWLSNISWKYKFRRSFQFRIILTSSINFFSNFQKSGQSFTNTPFASMAYKGNRLNAFVIKTKISWIIDSGKLDYMIDAYHSLTSYSPCGNLKVRIVDRSLSSIARKMSIQITNFIVLNSVFHVPNLYCNLISIS